MTTRVPDSTTFDDVFDALADALTRPGSRAQDPPSFSDVTIRTTAHSFGSEPTLPAPPPTRPMLPRTPRGDRSRDRAVYAAPHKPSRSQASAQRSEKTTRKIIRFSRRPRRRWLAWLVAATLVSIATTVAAIAYGMPDLRAAHALLQSFGHAPDGSSPSSAIHP